MILPPRSFAGLPGLIQPTNSMPPLDLEADGKADLDVKADGKDFMPIPGPSTSPMNPWKELPPRKEPPNHPIQVSTGLRNYSLEENKRDRTVVTRIPFFPMMEKKWGLLGKVTEKMSETLWKPQMQPVHGVNQPLIFELKSFIT